MRRALVVLALVFLALVGWFVFAQDKRAVEDGAGSGRGEAAVAPLDPARAAVKTPRQRSPEEVREEETSAFLSAWPEVGQDKPQDPALGALRGRVMRSQSEPAGEGVVESSLRGEVTARAKLKRGGEFLLMNVPPGKTIGLAARAPNFAPGGLDKLAVAPGETVDVGAVYLGAAMDPDTTDRVEVRVVNPLGEPIAGANVTATSTMYGALVALGSMEKQPGGTVVRATTDAKGVAVFEKLPPQSYDVFAEADGFAFEVEQRYLVQKDTQAVITLSMSPGQSIEGQVLDAAGKPVGKAKVGGLHWGDFTMNPSTTTDDDGKFKLGGLSGGNYMLFALRLDVGQKNLQNVAAGTKDLVINLEPGSEMALKVTDATTGKPVTAFAVRPFQIQPFAYLYSPHVDVTAADGIWRQNMAAQSWGVEVTAKGYAQKTLPSVPVPTKEPVEVKLEPAGVVHGKVTSRDGGQPIRGAKVFVKRGGLPPSPVKDQQTVTDEQGEFVLDSMPRTTVTIWISHVDHSEQSFPVDPQPRGEGGAAPPAQAFVLGSGGRIVGHAFGDGHTSLAGESINLAKGAMDILSMRNAVVAADGSYEFKNVPPETYRVSLGGGFGGNAKNGVVVTDGGVVTVDFGADTGGQRLTGVVVKADKSPVANMGVQLDNGSGGTQQAETDAQGKFAFENVAPGRYSVHGSWGRTRPVDVVVKAEEPPAEVTLTAVTGSIEGRVIDAADGKPMAGVWVDCEQVADGAGNAPSQAARARRGGRPTGPDGTFKMTSLDDGRYLIRGLKDPYGAEIVDGIQLAAGEVKTGVEMRMTTGANALTGVVKTAMGVPVEGASLSVKDAQGRRVFSISFTNSSSDGTYTQGQLKPGEYEATMEKDGFAPSTQRVTIDAGKPTKADFTLLQGGSIEVTARIAGGDAVAGADVTLLDSAGNRVEKSLTLQNLFATTTPKTDANGQITVRGVAAGTYTVKLRRDDGVEQSAGIVVVEGAGAAVEIAFNPQ